MQALIPRLTGRAISDAVVDRSPENFGRTLATLALAPRGLAGVWDYAVRRLGSRTGRTG